MANEPNITEDKRKYAAALLKHPDDPYKAALVVVGGDLARGLVMSREWPTDPEVEQFKDLELADKGDLAFLDGKAEVARRLLEIADNTVHEAKDRLKALDQYAEIMEIKPKAGTVVNNNTLVDQRKVMVVTDHGTDSEWEAKLVEQQAQLTHDGARPTVN